VKKEKISTEQRWSVFCYWHSIW